MSEYVDLEYWQVALATSLMIANVAASIALRLGLERSLLISGVRAVLQLLLVGLMLEWAFQFDRWYVVLGLGAIMTIVAGATAAKRSERPYRGVWIDAIFSLWASAWVVTAFALFAVFQDLENWHRPQYAIPLLGMVLGNALNGVSLGLNALTTTVAGRRDEIESLLALGATRWEAARDSVRHAVRTGMIPVVNALAVVGLVSLPGMMTGQLIAGMEPLQAVKYQIVIMFLIASATSFGTVGIVLLGFRRLFNERHQMRPDDGGSTVR